MRLMGQPPMRLKEFTEYLRVVQALIRGEEVDYTHRGVTHPITFMLREYRYLDVEHHIPLYVAGDGPKTQALAGALGDGLMTSLPLGGTVKEAIANARRGAESAGRKLEHFQLAALINLAMLEPGESLSSDRILADCGPAVMSAVHAAVDQVKESGDDPPEFAKPIWNAYMQFHMARPAAARPEVPRHRGLRPQRHGTNVTSCNRVDDTYHARSPYKKKGQLKIGWLQRIELRDRVIHFAKCLKVHISYNSCMSGSFSIFKMISFVLSI